MTRYIAFLRAINVGGRTVKMDELRTLFAAMGFAGVATFIASGNVIFAADHPDAAALQLQIEGELQQAGDHRHGTRQAPRGICREQPQSLVRRRPVMG